MGLFEIMDSLCSLMGPFEDVNLAQIISYLKKKFLIGLMYQIKISVVEPS